MGLDIAELVIEVEDRFGVKLEDRECARIRTVADLAALVMSRLPRPSGTCPTARMFFKLRGLMVDNTSAARRTRPGTPLIELFPSGFRRAWKLLRKQEPRLPRLVPAPAVGRALLCVAAAALYASMVTTWTEFGGAMATYAFLAIFLASPFVYGRLCRRLPNGIQTVGDVVRTIAPLEVAHSPPGKRLLAELHVLDEVRRVTATQLGLSLEEVLPASDLVDLGL